MFPFLRSSYSLLFLIALVLISVGLVTKSASAQVAAGTPPFSSVTGGPDVIDLANLNSHLTIPVLHKSGRGSDFTYDLVYDSSIWYPSASSGTNTWTPVFDYGWNVQTAVATGFASFSFSSSLCYDSHHIPIGTISIFSNWTYHDIFGVAHPFIGTTRSYDGCTGTDSSLNVVSTDGSGYRLQVTGGGPATMISVAGKNINVPNGSAAGSSKFIDRNGNQITDDGSGHFYDTLSSSIPVLTVSTAAPSATVPVTLSYLAPSGANATHTVRYASYAIQTAFGCTGIIEYGSNGTTTANLVSEIDLPDISVNPNDKYTFVYETTPGHPGFVTGRLISVTLPTGGTITYAYTGGSSGNITCSNGSTSGLKRYTPDTGSNYWEYDRSPGTGAAYTTTVTDPQSNKTVVQFQGIYETQRDFYQGAVSSSNLLQTIETCYNGNATNCTSTAITLPISQRKIVTVLPGGLQSEHDDLWNTYGAPTESDDYDFGTGGSHGALLKKTLATYTTMGNINAFAQAVTVCNGTGTSSSCNNVGTPVSQIKDNYDETSVVGTTGTPQHTNPTTVRGNLTSTNSYVNATTFLTKSATYYDTGNLSTSTDVNGGLTTYNYQSGLPSCYNSFATSTTEAISTLSTSKTWNCTGGVQLTSTDENGQTTTTAYLDQYFWRPASTTDPTLAVTSICYGLVSGTCSVSPTQTESTLTFNSSNSTVDRLTTLDGLGRTHVQQTRQGPGLTTFDSVETDYDSVGRVSKVTLPYSGSAGQTNSTIAATSTTYDALSRPLSVADGGLGSITYSYGTVGSQQNDVLVIQKPAPTGENTKARQLESDGLGRLTSICEVTAGTAAWPGAACGQNTAQTGYLTKYTYDPVGNLLTVTQNAQATSNHQTRTFAYDWKNRMVSETVPEIGASGNGTAYYTYDADSTMCGNGAYASAGDLVKTIDASSNCIMSYYDSLHRLTDVGNNNQAVNHCKRFRYDNSSGISGSTKPAGLTNTLGRLIEAATDKCDNTGDAIITDEWFSYTARGEISDSFESTPSSGTFYYHTTQTYWANRGPYQLSGNIGLPTTLTYGADSEGRTNTVSATSGQNPVSSTTYSTANKISALTFGSGSGDTDSYTYDQYTNRMTQYKFTVNSVSLTGVLGWNANSSVQTQNITDVFNSADTQNCSYVYDDVSRVTSANCGSAAAQTFSYDPFGNISKSGSPNSFQPIYSNTTNRISSVSGTAATYDNNGNATNDTFHTFTWDAYGHPLTVDSGQSDAVSVTYDALSRMVEQNRGGTHTQIVYSPRGQKLALMSGQTLSKAMVPLPGKAFVIYNSSGPLYYAHPDLLGSIRLATTTTRVKYFDTAYAPFGETYAYSGTLDAAYTGQMGDLSHRQDTAGGLYDFPAREYSTQGRWPSPDPAGVAATCTKDPQSQNRYAYVRNNPITRVDPSGMVDCNPEDPFCEPCWWDPFFCGGGGGGGGGFVGGGGSGEPKPRAFPWPQLPTFFFGKLGVGLNGRPNQLSFAEAPGVCLCSYITPITIKLETQRTGCTYICSCPGISIARSDPNPRPWCAFLSCPDLTLFRPNGLGRGVFFFGVPVPWCT